MCTLLTSICENVAFYRVSYFINLNPFLIDFLCISFYFISNIYIAGQTGTYLDALMSGKRLQQAKRRKKDVRTEGYPEDLPRGGY